MPGVIRNHLLCVSSFNHIFGLGSCWIYGEPLYVQPLTHALITFTSVHQQNHTHNTKKWVLVWFDQLK